MIAQNRRIFALLAATVIMLACMPTLPSLAPASAPAPTFDPNSLQTAIVETAAAAAAETALVAPTFTPTFTPVPTETPTQTASPTATVTFVFFLPTFTLTPTLAKPGSSGLDFECQVVSQSPISNSTIQRGAAFDMKWKVANIGKKPWDSNSADYRYVKGEKMHRAPALDFEQSVPSGGMIELVVPMQAPAEAGTYQTLWSINIGKERVCSMNLVLVVE